MDENKVLLSITGKADNGTSDDGTMELQTEAKRYMQDQTHCLSYDETELSGMQGTTTTVKVNGGKVSIIRLGSVNSLMEFEEGRRHETMYTTPFGDISMSIVTKGVNIDYDDKKLPVGVNVKYNIEVGGITNSKNSLNIRVRDK